MTPELSDGGLEKLSSNTVRGSQTSSRSGTSGPDVKAFTGTAGIPVRENGRLRVFEMSSGHTLSL